MTKVRINDVDLHYQCLGEGEPVVLVHGLAANLAFWYPGIASALAQNYQVVVFDLRGHGHSSIPPSGYGRQDLVEDLRGLLSHLNLPKVHLVGHSLGARTVTCFASTYPRQVATLTIADTLFQCLQPGVMKLKDWPYWETWKQKMEALGATLPADDAIMDFRMLLELDRIYSSVSSKNPQKANRLSLKSRELGARGRARWQELLATTTIVEEFDQGDQVARAELAELPMPTCIIYGEHSHCLPTYQQLQAIIPNCHAVLMPNTGHFHPVIKPQEFATTLQQFLSGHTMESNGVTSASTAVPRSVR
ncbi:MAG: alpha/beta fold hydrolase [Leptolyngbyaceae cyanobacterium]